MYKKSTSTKPDQVEFLLGEARSKERPINVVITIPPSATPSKMKLTIQKILDDYYMPPGNP